MGRQPYAPATFTPGEIPGTHFLRLSQPQGTWFRRGEPRKKSPVTPLGIDPGTVRLVAQLLNFLSIFIEVIPLCNNISILYVPSYTTIYIKITQLRVTV